MSIEITSWLRAYFALQGAAMESRGFIEINSGTDDAVRWPRTIGGDVIAIAAVVDPYVRAQPLRFGGHGLARRWRACSDDLQRLALVEPHLEYTENRSFWRTLPAVCVYLHSVGAPLPPRERWDALIEYLADPIAPRNSAPDAGPFKSFDVKTYSDLFIEQLKYLRDVRGFDMMDPESGMGGSRRVVPRTTNGDVVLLADYWGKQLDDAKSVSGTDGVEKHWKAMMVDIDANARTGDPNAVYTKNNGFWRVLSNTAHHVNAAEATPSKADIMLGSLKDSIKNLPSNIVGGVKTAASEVVEAVGGLAHAAGKIGHEAGKGLFTGFGTPLLVGAGLVGLYLVSRATKRESVEG